MQGSIKKWGNALAVRLNKGIAKRAGVTEGTIVRISVRPGRIVVVDVEQLDQRLSAAKPQRTLSDVIDSLPFKRRGAPRLMVEMADDDAPALRVPGRGRATEVGA